MTLERAEREAVVRVRDTGVGISPELQERIFQPFEQQRHDELGRGKGLGLGLALAKGIVELHHGAIEACSEGRDAGAELIVRLPLTSGPATEEKREAAHAARPQRILLVEDNADAAEMLNDLLERAGHEVTVADSGERALELLRSRRADVVLCDLGLPDISGYDIALDPQGLRAG